MDDKHKEDLNREHLKEELKKTFEEKWNGGMRQLKVSHSMCYNRDIKSLDQYLGDFCGQSHLNCKECHHEFALNESECMQFKVNKELIRKMRYYVAEPRIEYLCGKCIRRKEIDKICSTFGTVPEVFGDTTLYPVFSFWAHWLGVRRFIVCKKTSYYALLLSFFMGGETFTEQKDRDLYKDEMQILEWMTGLDLKGDYMKMLFPPDGIQKVNEEDKGKDIETILSQIVDKVRMERIEKKEADE